MGAIGLLDITGCRKRHLGTIRLIHIAHVVRLVEFVGHVKNKVIGHLHKKSTFFVNLF